MNVQGEAWYCSQHPPDQAVLGIVMRLRWQAILVEHRHQCGKNIDVPGVLVCLLERHLSDREHESTSWELGHILWWDEDPSVPTWQTWNRVAHNNCAQAGPATPTRGKNGSSRERKPPALAPVGAKPLDMADDIRAFLKANDAQLKAKE